MTSLRSLAHYVQNCQSSTMEAQGPRLLQQTTVITLKVKFKHLNRVVNAKIIFFAKKICYTFFHKTGYCAPPPFREISIQGKMTILHVQFVYQL